MRFAILAVLVVGALAVAAEEPVPAPAPAKEAEEKVGHPDLLDESFMFVPCAKCHETFTPDVVKEWNASRHGIGNVKCYQCHGTYENCRKTPKEETCAICHGAEAENHVKGKACWDCHPVHRFTGHGKGGRR